MKSMDHTEMVLGLLRDKLLALHKTLVDIERFRYERSHGSKVPSGEFLNLLLTDPSMDWLRRISELIVWIDEVLDPDELTADEEVESVFARARKLLTPSELGEEFEKKYHEALQRDPNVIMAHKEVRDVLNLRPESPR
jgi:hypothetical protein